MMTSIFFFQAEDGIRDYKVTGVQTCALPIYWKKFGELKPKGFDSYVQQFDRLVNQQDKIIHTAQYAGYLEWKKKGAPVGFNSPAAGGPGTTGSPGRPTHGPPPTSARPFLC